MVNNEIYLRRRQKIWLEAGTDEVPEALVGAMLKNLEPLGYTLSPELVARVRTLSMENLEAFYAELVGGVRALVGAHVVWKPMYPNFPQQVMEMSEAQLYVNAIIHYLTNQLPQYQVKARLPLWEKTQPKVIELGSAEEFEALFSTLIASKNSLSESDRADAKWFVQDFGNDAMRLVPAEIPLRETRAHLGVWLWTFTDCGPQFLEQNLSTATDVLRLCVALSGGDVSLATPGKFINVPRPLRRFLLAKLDAFPNALEDMNRHRARWIRLGEKLHPGEFCEKFPRASAAFQALRAGETGPTFGSRVEAAIEQKNVEAAVTQLQSRPGEMARRLDHLLRLAPERANETLEAFSRVAPRVATPVLLQVLAHFKHRGYEVPASQEQPPKGWFTRFISGNNSESHEVKDVRVFFPKGEVANVWGETGALPPLDGNICAESVRRVEAILVERFSSLEPLGACFLDPRLERFPTPFAGRSASKALRTLPRGSRFPLPDANVIRLFLWWKNGHERTDIDLSAALYDADFKYKDVLSYYNLKGLGCAHSGDIVNAPNGAAEFIDLDIEKLRKSGARYVVMAVNSYTSQPFCDLPECFAGWMARQKAGSGEIFEPRTVQDRVDLAARTRICLPLMVDLEARESVWADLALSKTPLWNNVENNLRGVSLLLRAMFSLQKPTLHDLFALHIAARGHQIETPDAAQTVFALDQGLTPFDGDQIAAHWL